MATRDGSTPAGPRTDGTALHRFAGRLRELPGFGRIYLAVNRTTYAPAIVEAYTGRHTPLPAGMEVLVSTGSEPQSLTVEVRSGGTGPLAELLADGSNLLDAALGRAETIAHLANPPRPPAPASPPVAPAVRRKPLPRKWGRRVALGVAGVLVLAGLARWVRPHEPAPDEEVAAPVAFDVVPEASFLLTNTLMSSSTKGKAWEIPAGPLKGQKRPPCERDLEYEIRGGCWYQVVPKDGTVPKGQACPSGVFEHDGRCFMPAGKPERLPAAISR